MDLIIDNLPVDDWEQVRAIYIEGIRTGQATFEVTAPTWDQFDASHLPECRLAARAPREKHWLGSSQPGLAPQGL